MMCRVTALAARSMRSTGTSKEVSKSPKVNPGKHYSVLTGLGFGAVVDCTLALYPILAFWNLKMRLHIKVGLAALFGCGLAAAVCAAVKTKQLGTLTATSDLTCE